MTEKFVFPGSHDGSLGQYNKHTVLLPTEAF